jgi:Leucine-rich repeat (LRR) protein
MIRRLIILLLIVGCEKDTVAPVIGRQPSSNCTISDPGYIQALEWDEVELWGVTYDIETTTSIDLNNQELTGSIPPEIGCLTNLEYLYLYDNQLTGGIPSEIGNLTNLDYLALFNNQLTGEIPPEVCDLIESNNLDINWILTGNNLINTCD